MAESPLRILERAMLLEVGSKRPPHHLKSDEVVGNSQLLGDRTNPPAKEVLSPARDRLASSLPRPKVGNINASGEGSALAFFYASMIGRTCSGTPMGARLERVLKRPG